MESIYRARHDLLMREQRRPPPGRAAAVWADGRYWRQTFDELLRRERQQDETYAQRAASFPVGSDRAGRELRWWLTAAQERADWHRWLHETHRVRLSSYAPGGHDQPPPDLRQHTALSELHLRACDVRAALIGVMYLEDRRRAHALGGREWAPAWHALQEALAEEALAQRRLLVPPEAAALKLERRRELLAIARLQHDTARERPPHGWLGRIRLQTDMARVRLALADTRGLARARALLPNSLSLLTAFALVCALLLSLLGGPSQPKPIETTSRHQRVSAHTIRHTAP